MGENNVANICSAYKEDMDSFWGEVNWDKSSSWLMTSLSFHSVS